MKPIHNRTWYNEALNTSDPMTHGVKAASEGIKLLGIELALETWTNRMGLASEHFVASRGAAGAWRVMTATMAAYQHVTNWEDRERRGTLTPKHVDGQLVPHYE